MSESEIMRVQREALMRFSKGDRKEVIRLIEDYGQAMRAHFKSHSERPVSADDLCQLLQSLTSSRN